MKNKNGFTLIEIIICIVLIVLIGTITIISFNKKDDNNEYVAFVDNLRLNSTVYLEVVNDPLLIEVKNPNDFIFVKLEELIHLGLLKEEYNNPYTDGTYNEYDLEYVKIYMNEDYMIDIEYPTKYITKNKDVKAPVIHLENNFNNECILPNSIDIFNDYKEDNSIISKIQGGEYNCWEETGFYLAGENSYQIETVDEDWVITKVWDKNTRTWTYTYSIKEDGPTNIPNKEAIEDATRTVKLVDKFGPILVSNDNVYIIRDRGHLDYWFKSQYFNTNDRKISHNELMSSLKISDEYYIFDNYDGRESFCNEMFFEYFEHILEGYTFTYNGINASYDMRYQYDTEIILIDDVGVESKIFTTWFYINENTIPSCQYIGEDLNFSLEFVDNSNGGYCDYYLIDDLIISYYYKRLISDGWLIAEDPNGDDVEIKVGIRSDRDGWVNDIDNYKLYGDDTGSVIFSCTYITGDNNDIYVPFTLKDNCNSIKENNNSSTCYDICDNHYMSGVDSNFNGVDYGYSSCQGPICY